MGSEHFVGLAGSGAATGIAVVAYEWQVSHLFHVFFNTLTLLLLANYKIPQNSNFFFVES